jgi:hypothetical protein
LKKLTGFGCSAHANAGALSSGDFSRFLGRLTGEDAKIGHFPLMEDAAGKVENN